MELEEMVAQRIEKMSALGDDIQDVMYRVLEAAPQASKYDFDRFKVLVANLELLVAEYNELSNALAVQARFRDTSVAAPTEPELSDAAKRKIDTVFSQGKDTVIPKRPMGRKKK